MGTISKFENPWDNKNKPGKEELDEIIKKGQQRLLDFLNQKNHKNNRNGFGGGNDSGTPDFSKFLNSKLIITVLLVLTVMWLSTGFYTVQPDEEAVVLRFGKYSRTAPSGLNYRLPYPIEKVMKVSVTRVNKEEIGFQSSGKRITNRQELLENTISEESQMLTTDENIVDINFEVQWVIVDAKKFLFNVRDLYNENTVKSTAESAMREVIGLAKITDVLAEERSKTEQSTKILLQSILDSYDMGVNIVRVQLLRVDPPQEALDAYRDVQNAKQDKEQEINKAFAYRNDIVPRARGEAEKVIQEAEGYKKKVIADAQGEAERFNSVYEQYKKAKDVTRKRMYLETMEEILRGMDKIILDKSSTKNTVPYLPLNELMKKKTGQ
jgi:membrane protease subunit HflK